MKLLPLLFALLPFGFSCSTKQNLTEISVQKTNDTIATVIDRHVKIDPCHLNQRTDTVNSTITVRAITEDEFKSLAEQHLRKSDEIHYLNSDSLELVYQQSFPSIFKLEDSTYTFKSWAGHDIKVKRNTRNLSDDKLYEDYKFINVKCNKVIIYTSAYESWGFLVVDPETGIASGTLGIPTFINCSVYYSTSNYYGEEEISIVDIENKKAATVLFANWETEQVFNINYDIVYKLKNGQCRDNPKHLMISMR